MKKFFSAFLAFLLLLLCSSSLMIVSSVEDMNINGDNAEAFAEEVGDLIQKQEGTFKSEYENDCIFKSCRLIVKSSSLIDTLGAVSVVNGYEGLWVLQFEDCDKTEEAYNYYLTRAGIEFVEIDMPVTVSSTETVTQTESTNLSWGPGYINIDTFNQIIEDKSISTAKTVVAVIDTGVEASHSFLSDRVEPTMVNTSSSGTRNSSADDNGHGTQVAGVIADSTSDSVIIKPYKVLNNYGQGTTATVAAGILCAILDEVDVINMSLGFYEDSPILELAVKKAYDNDIIMIAAAGNDSTNEPYYPASYDEVIKVTAINNQNIIANFSNYGDDVDFAAPGVDIYTTHIHDSYMKVSGTSIASPFVAALAATINSLIPDASPEEVIKVIENNVLSPADYDSSEKYGLGIINAPEIGNDVVNISGKTKTPYFSHKSNIYTDSFELEISCDTPDAEIYYSTDGTFPSKYDAHSTKYTGPVTVSKNTVITAVAYSSGQFRSKFATFMAIVAPYSDENKFEIDSSGTILSFSGTETSFSVPDTVNGITVTGIGASVFASSDVFCINLPNTVTSIDTSAFEECSSLRTIIGHGVISVGDNTFYNCSNLTYPIFGQLSSIGKYSFYNVCTYTNSINGSTYYLDLTNVTAIPEGAFMGSAISDITLGYISSVEKYAFTDCSELVKIYIENVVSLPNSVFSGCTSLKDAEIKGMTFVSKSAFSGCESLERISAPDATFVNALAFENCTALTDVNLGSVSMMYSNAFKGCSNLRLLSLPELTSFEVGVSSNGAYPAFPQNLETFHAPKLTKTVSKMFYNCPSVKNILLNGATTLVANTFMGCTEMIYLNIQSVEEITLDAFSDSSIKFMDARSLVSADYLPSNSGILLTDVFTQANQTSVNTVIYGFKGTYAEEYALNNGYEFIPIPFISTELPRYVTDNSETVSFIPVGFNLEFQWYYNPRKTTEGSQAIEGATASSYTFTESDEDGYYYCEVIQNFSGNITTAVTSFVCKDTTPANYGAYNLAVKKAQEIDRTRYIDCSALDAALAVDVSGKYSFEQSIVDEQTDEILTAIKNLKLKKVQSLRLYTKKTNLGFLQKAKLYVGIGPENATYSSIKYSIDNTDVLWLSDSGYIWCIGNGKAIITATLTNHDGSTIVAKLAFKCDLDPGERILSVFVRFILMIFSI